MGTFTLFIKFPYFLIAHTTRAAPGQIKVLFKPTSIRNARSNELLEPRLNLAKLAINVINLYPVSSILSKKIVRL